MRHSRGSAWDHGAGPDERSLFRIFKPSWWRLKSVIARHYDYTKHAVAPSVSHVLGALHAEYRCAGVAGSARDHGAGPDERSLFRIFKPSWWRLKSVIARHYDYTKHAVAPSVSHVLGALHAEYLCVDALQRERQAGISQFGEEPAVLLARAVQLRQQDKGAPQVDAVRALLLEPTKGAALVEALTKASAPLSELLQIAPSLLLDFR